MAQHPFSTRKGRAFRDRIIQRDTCTCQMCGTIVAPGRTGRNAAAVDHIRPIALRPDLTWDEGNLRTTCRACHSICLSIEARHAGDADAIAKAKLAYAPVGLDGYRVRT